MRGEKWGKERREKNSEKLVLLVDTVYSAMNEKPESFQYNPIFLIINMLLKFFTFINTINS